MKTHTPTQILYALVTSAFSFNSSALAQISTATLSDWEQGLSIDATHLRTWDTDRGSYRHDHSPMPTDFSIIYRDGETVVPTSSFENLYVSSSGYLYDSPTSTTPLQDEQGNDRIIGYDIKLNSDYTYSYYDEIITVKSGTTMIAQRFAQIGTYKRDTIGVADYAEYRDADGNSSMHLNVGDSNNFYLYGGKGNSSFGSTTDATKTSNITLTGVAQGYSTPEIYDVVGGNRAFYSSGEAIPETRVANFYGTSTVVVKEDVSAIGIIGGNALTNAEQDRAYSDFEAHFHGESRISMQDSTSASLVVGGNLIGIMESSAKGTSDFLGDSTIVLRDNATAGRIIGGNAGNQNGSSFYGNSKIEIHSAGTADPDNYNLFNQIVGANMLTAKADSVFQGDSSISIHSRIASYEATDIAGIALNSYSGVVGGFAGTFPFASENTIHDFSGYTATLQQDAKNQGGNTNVTIDFSSSPPSASSTSFDLSIVGGSMTGNGMNIIQEGTANLNFKNTSDTQFRRVVVGGNVNLDVDFIPIKPEDSGPAFERMDQSSTSIKRVVINVDGGDFSASLAGTEGYNSNDLGNMFVAGSLSAGGGAIHTGSTDVTVKGQFGILVGGSAATPGQGYIVTEGYRLTSSIGSGSYTETYADTKTGSISHIDTSGGEKSVVLHISGTDTSSELLVAGSYISSDVSSIVSDGNVINTQAITQGDIDLTISGGTHRAVTAGSFVGKQIAQSDALGEGYKVDQGHVNVQITGDTIFTGGVIAAAGIVEGMSSTGSLAQVVGKYYIGYEPSIEPTAEVNSLRNQFEIYKATFQTGSSFTLESLYPAPVGYTFGDEVTPSESLPLDMKTDSTTLSLGKDVRFEGETIISGAYSDLQMSATSADEYTITEGDTTFNLPGLVDYMKTQDPLNDISDEDIAAAGFDPLEFRTAAAAWYQSWKDAYAADMQQAALMSEALATHTLSVAGNRLLLLHDGNYQNLARSTFIEFDEINIDADSVVDFTQNNQDLDRFAGRNMLADGATRITVDGEGQPLMAGSNTLRKTGDGILKLSATNGQLGNQDNLQFVVEAGTVILAKESAATTQSNFKTFVLQAGATLDMRAANYDATTGEYQSGNAGINGDLLLEMDSILLADASRDASGSGTMLSGGSLQILGEGQVTLRLDNLDLVQVNQTAEAGHLLFEAGASYFEITLFSGLDFSDINSTNLIYEVTGGTFDNVAAKGVLASQYFAANFDMTDVYLVYNANGDVVLTGAQFIIPEPSTATLSLFALAGFLARRVLCRQFRHDRCLPRLQC